ncbi:hypothetical protein O4220_19600 [Rhodococcus ruber]|uniref:HNH endonuclease n=1 Tax=Rhodococcus ruber TaxID=1830 RepID=A0ABT4MJZ7_9NOCA|nr:hypothetical protein [Rhodococcus ruber]MCZ4520720.1 hypothetical protein [Rhodococcus ruber]
MNGIFPRERVERARDEKWRETTALGDQIDAPLRTAERENYSSRAQDVSVLTVVLEWMAQRGDDRVFDAENDPTYLPGIGLNVENSSLTGNDELLPGVSTADLRGLHNTAQAVAGSGIHIGQRVQLSAFEDDQFQVTLGRDARRTAEELLALRHGHQCTLCEWRNGARTPATCGIAVTCGTVLRVINTCERCRANVAFEYSDVDVFYPSKRDR